MTRMPEPGCASRVFAISSRFPALSLLLVTLLLYPLAAAELPVTSDSQLALSADALLFADPAADWRDIAGRPAALGQRNNSFLVRTETFELPLWIRMDLDVGDQPPQRWLLDIGNAFGGKLSFYHVSEGELLAEEHVVKAFTMT